MPDFHSMSIRKLRRWIDSNPGHPDMDEAQDALFDAEQDATYERETFGEPEDSPCLDDPWWKHP